MSHAILLMSCHDQKGITAGITNFVFENNGNIVHADQHIDEQTNTFFMRVEWSLEGFALAREDIAENFKPLAQRFQIDWTLCFSDQPTRVAVFVSKHTHCLTDLLFRREEGQLDCEIPLIISNHPDAKSLAQQFHVKFYEFPINDANKSSQEQQQIRILQEQNIDLIVLARYHQLLSEAFVSAFKNKIINIHHSFLPAFAGRDPYAQAYQKGVKIIGATSHFVVKELDAGPIIEQDTVRISHRDSLEDLKRKGQDLEKIVLSRAVRLALQRKILCYNNKTVIFD